MPRSKVRGGRAAHNKRVKKRNEKVKQEIRSIEHLKMKIYEEAKDRYEQQQNNPTQIKLNNDDGHNNS